jgi:hypothetical protein
MRRLVATVSLGVVLASTAPAADRPPAGRLAPGVASPAETRATVADERPGWTRRLVRVLRRLRLNPGHDHVDRSAASRLRP